MEEQYWVAKTLHGLEDVLAKELEQLAAEEITILTRAVKFKATLWDIYHIAPTLRTAQAILMELYEFEANSDDELYKGILDFNWEKWLKKDGTFRIEAVTTGELFTHSKFAALRAKDAIADQFMSKYKERPSVGFNMPDLVVHIHINNNNVRVALNATDEPLFKRGYKLETGKAPLNECLAAGILLKAGLPENKYVIDPMCGSGTFGIEAAMILANIPPNLNRRWFGFMGWPEFNNEDFQKSQENLSHFEVEEFEGKIECSDVNPRVLQLAKNNAMRAGVFKYLKFKEGDFFQPPTKDQEEGAVIILNPPYDERMVNENINEFYKEIGNSLKFNYPGCTSFIISSNLKALKHIGLKPAKKTPMFNGGLESYLMKYVMFSGKYKEYKSKIG